MASLMAVSRASGVMGIVKYSKKREEREEV